MTSQTEWLHLGKILHFIALVVTRGRCDARLGLGIKHGRHAALVAVEEATCAVQVGCAVVRGGSIPLKVARFFAWKNHDYIIMQFGTVAFMKREENHTKFLYLIESVHIQVSLAKILNKRIKQVVR